SRPGETRFDSDGKKEKTTTTRPVTRERFWLQPTAQSLQPKSSPLLNWQHVELEIKARHRWRRHRLLYGHRRTMPQLPARDSRMHLQDRDAWQTFEGRNRARESRNARTQRQGRFRDFRSGSERERPR